MKLREIKNMSEIQIILRLIFFHICDLTFVASEFKIIVLHSKRYVVFLQVSG